MGAAPQDVIFNSVRLNSMSVLPAMLASKPAGIRTVLGDNGSVEAEALASQAGGREARLIRNADDRGSGAACSQAADWVALLHLASPLAWLSMRKRAQKWTCLKGVLSGRAG